MTVSAAVASAPLGPAGVTVAGARDAGSGRSADREVDHRRGASATFLNEPVIDWCRRLEVTRSRAYRKNDQAWVEQKNGAIVRGLVGYGRFEGRASVAALARVDAAARLHGNLFLPSFKLRSKTRSGARVVKRYHAPEPPVAGALAHPALDETVKAELRRLRRTADPVLLLAAAPTVEQLIADLATAWREGERRPTHRRPYRRVKPMPRRRS